MDKLPHSAAIVLLLGVSSLLLSEPSSEPYFTGPLLTPSSTAIPRGHFNCEPYLFWTKNTGSYGSDKKRVKTDLFSTLSLQIPIEGGTFQNSDFGISPQISRNKTLHTHSTVLNDIPFSFGFQLHEQEEKSWEPSIKLKIEGSIPIGKFKHLDPKKNLTDAGGNGSWNPSIGLCISKILPIYYSHYLNARYFMAYTAPTSVHTEGKNIYIDSFEKAKISPGDTFTSSLGLEYSFSQKCSFALDVQKIWTGKTKVFSKEGSISKLPSSMQVSLAPAIEYNFNENMGLIVGGYWSVKGRNCTQFQSLTGAFNIYF